MDMRILTTFILIIFANAMISILGQEFRRNLWQSSYPGELLNALDSMTVADIKSRAFTKLATQNSTPTTTPTPSPIKRNAITKAAHIKSPSSPKHKIKKLSSPKKRMISEDNSAASTSAEGDDYDREYEKFVHNYFDDAADHYLSNDDGNSNESTEVSNLSSEVSYETDTTEQLDAVPYTSSYKAAKKAGKKCRKERRKREICVICKNLRNGERSETCSYERASEPERYAFETQRKYRTTRDRDNSSDDNADDKHQNESSEEKLAESKLKTKMAKPEKSSPSSSCIKRIINGKSCYYCKDAVGTRALKCFTFDAKAEIGNEMPRKTNNNKHQKRRIYKRMLSYVYEKGLDSNGTLSLPNEFNGNVTIPLE